MKFKQPLNVSFQGKNIYFQNPELICKDSIPVFTTRKVVVNDSIELSFDSINSSAFEIALTRMKFQMNDPVKIKLIHVSEVRPKMLGPEVR
ncbi:MAG: hypothetical protein HY064_00875 [Bacteroidetes bacterium]|nr:hypothetical protein [Bacteroidota bacterium]